MKARAVILIAMLAAVGAPVHAQVFKCVQPDGRITYQGTPCPAAVEQGEVRLNTAEPTPEDAARAAQRAERDRAAVQQRARAQEPADEAAQAADRVRQIRAENYDPEKCAAVRARLALAKQRDPIAFGYSPDVREWRQMESLYCGN